MNTRMIAAAIGGIGLVGAILGFFAYELGSGFPYGSAGGLPLIHPILLIVYTVGSIAAILYSVVPKKVFLFFTPPALVPFTFVLIFIMKIFFSMFEISPYDKAKWWIEHGGLSVPDESSYSLIYVGQAIQFLSDDKLTEPQRINALELIQKNSYFSDENAVNAVASNLTDSRSIQVKLKALQVLDSMVEITNNNACNGNGERALNRCRAICRLAADPDARVHDAAFKTLTRGLSKGMRVPLLKETQCWSMVQSACANNLCQF